MKIKYSDRKKPGSLKPRIAALSLSLPLLQASATAPGLEAIASLAA